MAYNLLERGYALLLSTFGTKDGLLMIWDVRSQRRVRLGPVIVEIRSNEPDFPGLRFFPDLEAAPTAAPDFTLNLCNLKYSAPHSIAHLQATRDQSYRAGRMARGYYLTDHFGPPAYLRTEGAESWIFAEDFEQILWPYAVKHLLTQYSVEHNLLHLKAAAVALDGQAVLLVGRGGSGKTVLMAQLCGTGARFLANTHVLLDGPRVLGIRTAMRVRRDQFFGPIIAQRQLAANVKPGEYTADPQGDLGWPTARYAPLGALCLVEYKGPRTQVIERLSTDVMLDYMEQFSLALNVYGLKEDVLDDLGDDIARFSRATSQMKGKLRILVESTPCYYLSCDAGDPLTLQALRAALNAGMAHRAMSQSLSGVEPRC